MLTLAKLFRMLFAQNHDKAVLHCHKQTFPSIIVILAEVLERRHFRMSSDCRWAIEQLSGGPMLTTGSPATSLATLHFLARQAFFADEAAPQVSSHTSGDTHLQTITILQKQGKSIRALKVIERVLSAPFLSWKIHLLAL